MAMRGRAGRCLYQRNLSQSTFYCLRYRMKVCSLRCIPVLNFNVSPRISHIELPLQPLHMIRAFEHPIQGVVRAGSTRLSRNLSSIFYYAVNMDTFLMDWLASDAQAVGQEQEPGQPGFIPSLSSPPWEGFLPSTAGLATPSMPQQSQFAAPAFPPSSQQVQQGGQAAQEVTAGPPTAPSSRPAPGPYSLRPRSVWLLPLSAWSIASIISFIITN